MSQFRNLLQKLGAVRSVGPPQRTNAERDAPEKGRPEPGAEPTYTAARGRDGVDDVYTIWNGPEARVVCKVHFWDEPDTNEAAEALADAQALVADLNTGTVTEARAKAMHPAPEWVEVPDEPLEPNGVTLAQEAISKVQDVMAYGGSFLLDPDGPTCFAPEDLIPYEVHDRQGQYHLLEEFIDWAGYVGRGMDPDTKSLIMFNAVEGKPPAQWLEMVPEETKWREIEWDWHAGGYAPDGHRRHATDDDLLTRELAALVLNVNTFEQDVLMAAERAKPREPERDRGIDLE